MRALFAVLGILLITSGAIVLGTPYLANLQSPSAVELDSPNSKSLPGDRTRSLQPASDNWIDQVRAFAEKANAPLSIIFGFMSLYYTRRTYHAQRR